MWVVQLPEQARGAVPPQEGTHAAPDPAQDGPAQEVALLKEHVQDLRDTLRAREREVQELHVTINRLLLALPAPAPPTVDPNGLAHDQAAEASAPPETQSAPPDPVPAGRSWWRRLWRAWALSP
jgi:hypothetical protein